MYYIHYAFTVVPITLCRRIAGFIFNFLKLWLFELIGLILTGENNGQEYSMHSCGDRFPCADGSGAGGGDTR